MMKYGFFLLICSILLGCNNGDENLLSSSELSADAVELIVTPKVEQTPLGFSVQYQANALLSDGRVIDVTHNPALTWHSTNENIATINGSGVAKGQSVGNVTISASGSANGETLTDDASLDITDATVMSLQVTPVNSEVPVGLSQQFIATALFSDGSTLNVTNDGVVTWSSSDTDIASVVSSRFTGNGLATGLSTGSITISASGSANGQTFTGVANLDVIDAVVTALDISPESSEIPIGLAQQFTAIATFSNGNTLDVTNDGAVNWSVNDDSVATITSTLEMDNGLATGISTGSVAVKASGNANGQTFTDVATLNVVDATVTALEVTPENAEVPVGLSQQFTATATLSDGSTLDVTNDEALSWSSSDSSIASIASALSSGNGLATGITSSTVTITAFGNANGQTFTDAATLNVVDAIVTDLEITPTSARVPIGLSQQFTATATFSDSSTRDVTNDGAISWSSSDISTATVISSQDTGNGVSFGVTSGDVEISVLGNANGSLFSDTASLEVLAATSSQLFGEEDSGDVSGNYLLGSSQNLSFRCGSIVDAMGTPEGGLVGGTGGTFYTVSAVDVVRVDVDWGNFTYDQSADVTISKIVLEYDDNSIFSCGQNTDTSDIQSDYWTVPAGEKFLGFHITSSAYAHSLRVISITE
ncbi:Ig-like domain-containing protein [Vibrio sp. TH_r3]|uniref:Ig-like domain-containing protein n=1 Tax=Vibrio sp. TH_r3 TaxID=3082084 RepID=UPI002954A39E|nr:Ig-like domain-containing protein [Vibrio sp. TH_r3]MDV7104857.1 Ig-like domain-containing protein [Vibrio sp. TH_r3]